MAADPTTTTTAAEEIEAFERELAKIWRAARVIAGTKLPELKIDAKLQER